jgi:hypothetical protein
VSSANKRKGATFEIAMMKFLRGLGITTERLSKAGSNDEGDLVCIVAGQTFILELKNRKKLDLPQFWREAEAEAQNYAKARNIETPISYVIVKRRNQGIEKAWVIETVEQWLKRESGAF